MDNISGFNLKSYFVHCRVSSSEIENLIKIINSDKYSGFLYQSNLDLFFNYLIFDEEDFFSFLSKIRQISNIVEIYQNTGTYIVKPTPKIVSNILYKKLESKN